MATYSGLDGAKGADEPTGSYPNFARAVEAAYQSPPPPADFRFWGRYFGKSRGFATFEKRNPRGEAAAMKSINSGRLREIPPLSSPARKKKTKCNGRPK